MGGINKQGRIFAVGLTIALGSVAHAAPVPVAHWKLDETEGDTAYDSSGNGHHGTLINMTLPAASVQGQIGTAFVFDGLTEKVDVPYSVALNPDQFSFTLWAKPNGGSGTYRSPLTSRTSSPQRGYILYEEDNNNLWSFWIGTGSGYSQLDGPAVRDGEWQHVACTYDGSTMTIYVDGMYGGSKSETLSKNTVRQLTIGAGGDTGTQYFFPGTIDDVRLYNVALSEAEVYMIYKGVYVTIEATDREAAEPADPGEFTVTASEAVGADLVVTIQLGGDATFDDGVVTDPDYTLTNVTAGAVKTVTIPADSSSATIVVEPIDDDEKESDETVVVTVLPGEGYEVGPENEDTVTIADDETPPLPFDLTSPADGAENVTHTPRLAWRAAAKAETYVVVVAANQDMTGEVLRTGPVSGTTFTVPESAGLAYDNVYHWNVSARNPIGQTDSENGPWSFNPSTMGPPTVTLTAPADGDTDVPASTGIRVRFSEPMAEVTADAITVRGPGGDVAGQAEFTRDGRTFVFSPAADLAFNATYTVTVDASVARDRAQPDGNRLDGDESGVGGEAGDDVTFSFTVLPPLVGLATGEGCAPGAGTGAAWIVVAIAALSVRGQGFRLDSVRPGD